MLSSTWCSSLEIRLGRCRHRLGVLLEGIADLALGASRFDHRPLHPAPAMDDMHRPDERCRVVHGDLGLEALAVLDQAKALDDMQLVAVRRAVIVNEGLRVLTDGVDDQRVTLVMPDRLAIP